MIITTIVNRQKFSRAVSSKTDNLVVSNIKSSMMIRMASIKDNVTGPGLSKRDRSTVTSHRTSVASLPVLAINEIFAISKSTPVQPRHKGAAISNVGNSLIRAGFLGDTRPSASALRVVDVFSTAVGPHSSIDDSLTSRRNFAWRTVS